MISRHVNLIRELLDDTMLDGKPSDSVLQGVLGDLNSIARECYSCATQCYKRKNFPETISALMGAFELAESYLEYVMCSNFTAEEIHNAHSQLQVDAIVSLLAYCFHELGDATKARTFTGYSILYCSDVNKKIPRASIDKYVASILEELRAHGETRETFIFSDFKRFVDSATHVFQARRVPKLHITGIWSAFRDSIERMSARILIGMRTKEPDALEDVKTIGAPLEVSVRLCVALETFLADIVMKSKGQMTGDGSCHTALVEVCSALANRKLIYSVYYASRDPQSAIDGLTRAYDTLSGAIEKLQHSASAVVDLGGVYGWRGVITMEITLISSYSNAHERMDSIGEDSINEENAIADIEQCLMHWGQHGNSPGILFDPTRVVCCLEAVCSSLSLISCPVLEKAARKLLKMFQSSADEHDVLPMVVPPLSLGLLDIHVDENAVGVEMGTVTLSGTALDGCGVLRQFELVDAEIGAAVASHFDDDTAQAYQHLLNAITVLHAVKGNTGKRSRNPIELKAAGMRELLMHLVLSDIHFSEGRSKFAIAEAKAALGICWKLSKKFASTPSASETGHFELPPEIASTRGNDCQLGNPSAAMYFAEAMQLVGGLNLRFFHRSPFYEYAELQLNSSHLEQAKMAMGLLSSCQERGTPMTDDHINDDATPTHHSCFQSDSEFVEQNCNEIIQRGDVLLIDGDSQGALACYTHVIQALSTAKNACSGHASSKILARAEARCWRKLMRLKSQTNDLTDTAAVEELLSVMKKLKRAMKSCESRLERVKCMLELGRVNIRLLRSSSSRAFLNLERTLALLEEAYWLGDHLGIPHLSQNLRTTLGMAYFVEIEDSAQDETDRMDGGERSSFLSWASGSLLANASSADIFDDPFSAMEMEADSLVKETMTMQLERLAGAGSPAKLQHNPLQEMIGSITKRVGELPDSWLPVSLAIGLASELVVTRIPTDGTTPISFCLPNVGWAKCMREMETIIKESRNYLLHADLYIYCGHGSGEKYLHRDKILSLQSACSAALLFGCSSGRLEKEGIFGPSGAVLAYLRAGSPAVLAMLWDVTDKDIDQLSVKVLQEWLLADNEDQATDCSRSLAQVLQDSRQVCKLQYLNGHAAVCYGLPLHVSTS
ncbi:hypothetical protein BBJ28_00001277 [Nothophytophthora sp. Chile5]|nr:hypothetical protein BBJ28_00001277 [Nothophytophthora sp. Chile5]